MTGLRVELEVGSADACPVVAAADAADSTARQVTWSRNGEGTVEQFELEDAVEDPPGSVESVFAYEDAGVYEFNRENDGCPCEHVEAAGYPVADVRAESDSLFLTLYLNDGAELSDLLGHVRSDYEDVAIRTIARADPENTDDTELVPVDRGRLTERQQEVLETAYAMGYFDYPRGANATEVAEALEICPSTLAEHMAAAQSKVLRDLLGEPV